MRKLLLLSVLTSLTYTGLSLADCPNPADVVSAVSAGRTTIQNWTILKLIVQTPSTLTLNYAMAQPYTPPDIFTLPECDYSPTGIKDFAYVLRPNSIAPGVMLTNPDSWQVGLDQGVSCPSGGPRPVNVSDCGFRILQTK